MSNLSLITPQLWPSVARATLDEKQINIHHLKHKFHKVYFPWDTEYNKKITYFSLTIQQRPLMVIVPNSTRELEKLLDFIKDYNLSVRFMNGRHSSQILDPEVLVDLIEFNKIKIDSNGNHIIVGGGSTQGQANDVLFNNDKTNYSHFGHPAHPHNDIIDAFAGGSASTVGCGGICTAGGIGILARSFGLTIDSIISYTITLPPTENIKSQTIVADKNNHDKLFWALRGGGASNFGIISNIKLDVMKVPKLVKFNITWPFINAVKILDLWKKTSIVRPSNYDEEISISANSSESDISLGGYYLFQDTDTLETATLNINNQFAQLIADFNGILTITEIEYNVLYKQLVANRTYYNFSYIQVFFLNHFSSRKVIELINSNKPDDGFQAISFQLLGGKIRDHAENSTAFFPRKANFFMDVTTLWNRGQSSQQRNLWEYTAVKNMLNDKNNKTMYVGFPIPFTDLVIQESNKIYYGKNYKKLQKIKANIDPLGLLTPCGTI